MREVADGHDARVEVATEEPADAGGPVVRGGGGGRERQESAGSYLSRGPARPRRGRRGEAEGETRSVARRRKGARQGPSRSPRPDASRSRGDGGGRGRRRWHRQGACSPRAGSAGGKLVMLLPPSSSSRCRSVFPPLVFQAAPSSRLQASASRYRTPARAPTAPPVSSASAGGSSLRRASDAGLLSAQELRGAFPGTVY